ncbi:Hpt domain-containing protein [Sphingomonas sp. ABOLE]|uniref:Hpt domain-containing protein n=1 Tax=Sphingomonas sp. ABOLE TaxID=1985878 RepID=UPI000F7EF939|nr:Hpt domain-containing protein [Sphingomonas sp. ABOLE]RSV40830.1 Hpt domain-containing protein [Sphingomonas sp. ABOLE]
MLPFDQNIFDETRNAVSGFEALLEICRSDRTKHLKSLGDAPIAGEFEAAILPAHTIKSAGRIVGVTRLGAPAEALETRLRTGGYVTMSVRYLPGSPPGQNSPSSSSRPSLSGDGGTPSGGVMAKRWCTCRSLAIV